MSPLPDAAPASICRRRLVTSLLVGAAVALAVTAPAVADPIGGVLVNPGTDEGAQGFTPPVVSFGNGRLSITNPRSNAPDKVITNTFGALPNEAQTGFRSFAGPDFKAQPYCGKGIAIAANVPGFIPKTFTCETADQETGVGGIRPGETRTYPYELTDPSYMFGLMWIEVWFNFTDVGPRCRPRARAASLTSVSPGPLAFAAEEEAGCVKPSKTRIVKATINRKKQTATFRLKANRTNRFVCTLYHGRRSSKTKCGAKKVYSGPLPKGDYLFVANAVNKGGTDPHAAYRRFSIR